MDNHNHPKTVKQSSLASQKAEKRSSAAITATIISLAVLYLILLGLNLYFQIRINKEQQQLFIAIDRAICSLQESMEGSFVQQKERIEAESQILKDQMQSSTGYLDNTVRAQAARVISNITETDRHLSRVNQVYSDLLEEQKKRTLESLYDEEALLDRLQNAGKLFKEGKYRQAYDEYSIVAAEQPDNLEVQFYKYYSLFLRNKGDQNLYRPIKNAFLSLEKRGFSSPEMEEVLSYIAGEEGLLP